MKKFDNYEKINSIELLIAEIEKLLTSKSYFSALYLALSLPDIFGKLVYPKNTKNKYIKWFNENVRNIVFGYLYSKNPLDMDDDSPKMNGETCYSLRCKLFHEGITDVQTSKIIINEFVLSFTDEDFVRGDYAGTEYELDKWDPKTNTAPQVKYFYVSCKGLTREITVAAKAFIQNNPDLDYPTIRINNGGGKINNDWFVR